MIFLSDLGRSFKEICSTILQLLTYKVTFSPVLCCAGRRIRRSASYLYGFQKPSSLCFLAIVG